MGVISQESEAALKAKEIPRNGKRKNEKWQKLDAGLLDPRISTQTFNNIESNNESLRTRPRMTVKELHTPRGGLPISDFWFKENAGVWVLDEENLWSHLTGQTGLKGMASPGEIGNCARGSV
ncbi:uncharacterized protein J3R85_006556 [Psidium guajava]|nr:uncharacterized protein J3R85_006556 [Psidium guajava]